MQLLLSLLLLTSSAMATQYHEIDFSKRDENLSFYLQALKDNDYNCDDESYEPDAYQNALDILEHAQSSRESVNDKIKSYYYSTSATDALNDSAGRIWITTSVSDPKRVESFSVEVSVYSESTQSSKKTVVNICHSR